MSSGFRVTDSVKRGPAGLCDIAKSIALPRDYMPKRMPTFPAACRTAVTSLEVIGDVSVNGAAERVAALTRYPSAPLFLPRNFLNYNTWNSASLWYLAQRSISIPTQALPFAGTNGGHFLMYGGDVFAVVPYGSNLSVRPTLIGNMTIETISLDPADESSYRRDEFLYPIAIQNDWTTMTNMPAGLMGFRVVNAVAATATFKASTAGEALWPIAMPVMRDLPLVYSETRCNASAVLFTNVTKVAEKEGTVKGARVFTAMSAADQTYDSTAVVSPSPYYFTLGHINNVHPCERYNGSLELGIYTYTLPHQNSDEFKDWTMTIGQMNGLETISGSTIVPLLHPMAGEPFSAILFKDLTSGVSQMNFTLNIHLEYKTLIPVFDIGFSAIPLEAYHAAQLSLLAHGCFFENSTHWKDVASAVLRGISMAIPLVAPQYGAYGRAAGALASMVRRKPATTPGRMAQAAYLPVPPARPARQSRKRGNRRTKKVRVRSRTPTRRPRGK